MTAPVATGSTTRALAALLTVALAPTATSAQADREYRYDNPAPAFIAGRGPVVCFDEGHNNLYTTEGDDWPFAELLRGDGFSVRVASERIAPERLQACEVFVIVTPVHASNRNDWSFPHPSAFDGDEIAALHGWVRGGGGLLLVADHSPIPGALADLATVFGVAFFDGAARNHPAQPLPDVFDSASGALHDHTIIHGRGPADEVEAVATWTGAAFQASRDFTPLMTYGPSAVATSELIEDFPHLPLEEHPVIAIDGWLAAAARDMASGRVVVLGETSMCTALRSAGGKPWGMNAPEGAHNPRFCLNVVRWLSRARVNPIR